ncbi:MAG: aldehyde dehydrogenase family protein [Rhodospirillaceae bacterium]|nr:aldehyde dehydrogenase family protein [Rhodospirillaceae bacterium]MYH36532.1 aldehyde dehydrogenase family protein [Rhodospirillaceae bacterium]MYK14674.1 aldehyde dehydrogenase family protein [Rhodospirillaceae bacterium]
MDKDLEALQRSRDLLRRARAAADAFRRMPPAQAMAIAGTVAKAAAGRARHYAEWAVRETGFGKVEDKIDKNLTGSIRIYEAYCDTPIGGIRQDRARNVVEIGRPAGVIVGLSNSTSPVGTVYFKAMLALMTRNAIVFSPHPAALACTADAARFLEKTARLAGAPADAIQILAEPTLKATNALMQSDETDLVIATGGAAMVRAAYSSGNPALGVGPGNTPVYVDRSADLASAAEKIVTGKEYDYGTPCSAPSVVLADRPVGRELRGLLEQQGAYFCSDEELATLEAAAFPGGRLNPAIIGQPAGRVAQIAGLSLPPETRAIVGLFEDAAAAQDSGSVPPMAREKLSVLLGAAAVDGVEGAIAVARCMLRSAGAGHTAAIFTGDPEQAVLFGAALDYYRIVVNGDPTNGAVGRGTALPVTFTIGTGFAGKSSIDHNLGPEDLIDWKRVAFPVGDSPAATPVDERTEPARSTDATVQALKEEIRRIVAEELARN